MVDTDDTGDTTYCTGSGSKVIAQTPVSSSQINLLSF